MKVLAPPVQNVPEPGAITSAWAADDLAAARQLTVTQCSQCHTFDKGEKHGQGPNLFGLLGREAASVDQQQSTTREKARTVKGCADRKREVSYCVVERPERKALAYNKFGYPDRPEEASHGTSLSGPIG